MIFRKASSRLWLDDIRYGGKLPADFDYLTVQQPLELRLSLQFDVSLPNLTSGTLCKK